MHLSKLAQQVQNFVARRAFLIVSISLLLTLFFGYFSALLYKNLRPDLEQLLPRSARSVVDLDEVAKRFRSLDHLTVLVFSKNTEGSLRFVQDFVEKLKDS